MLLQGATQGLKIRVTGVVQGVGFRPFIYSLAHELSLKGWVRNTSSGVEIEIDGAPGDLDHFVDALNARAPPLARIDQVHAESRELRGFAEFEIRLSQDEPEGFQPVSSDVATCSDCLAELFHPQDRRYRYPFINCTNCGPRFTIITDVPYDRPATTMAPFEMCSACRKEYEDPLDRRFHAQPVACPECGPRIWLEPGDFEADFAIEHTQQLLKGGSIVAIKGLGGFHLACDPSNSAAVRTLRERKGRTDKPLAVMMRDSEIVQKHCRLSDGERALLEGSKRPIVLLQRRAGSSVAPEVAPHQRTLGVMLPYTPLHHLLLETESLEALVMTSGNRSEEPISIRNREALDRLGGIADGFLLHDREIQVRCDDSVVRQDSRTGKSTHPVRRGRGYAPSPVRLPWNTVPILATGAELKNTFCLTKEDYAFLSQHIGNLGNFETLASYTDSIEHFERLFRIEPEVLAYDLHPDYLASRYALERAEGSGTAALGVQHHHAHIAACMAEHAHPARSPVIGVALDGTGYGEDGTIWGGEFLVADYLSFERAYWLRPVPLPGGDAAARQPWRCALSWLDAAALPWNGTLECVQAASKQELIVVRRQLETRINAPLSSSMGRLFDAVAYLAGVRQVVHYEAQAAIELEAIVDPEEHSAYPIEIGDGPIDPSPALLEIWYDRESGVEPSAISARFHNGIARMILATCEAIRRQKGLDTVALSGGVWQNMTLLQKTVPQLEKAGFTVYLHRQVPANDGGISLGQAVIAHHSMR